MASESQSLASLVKIIPPTSHIIHVRLGLLVGRDSVFGIATRYGLDGPGVESRWRRDFPHPTGPDRATGMRGVGPHPWDIAMPESSLYRSHKFVLLMIGEVSECLRVSVCPFSAEANLSSNEFI